VNEQLLPATTSKESTCADDKERTDSTSASRHVTHSSTITERPTIAAIPYEANTTILSETAEYQQNSQWATEGGGRVRPPRRHATIANYNNTKSMCHKTGSRTKGHTDKRPPDKRPQLPIYASIALLINVI